jgi:hypothetical protein
VDFSKLKLEIYDLFAIIIPGLLLCVETWVAIRGWTAFAEKIVSFGGSAMTALLLVAFALGHLTQELSDFVIKKWKGPRFFVAPRDHFWQSKDGEQLKALVKRTHAIELNSADAAFDHCLTRSQAAFPKRDVFLATADLARALWAISLLSIIPVMRIIIKAFHLWWSITLASTAATLVAVIVAALFWNRMVRFRWLSETPVFRAYVALGEAGEMKTANASSH